MLHPERGKQERADNSLTAAMLIRVSDSSLVDDLCAHFRRAGFRADLAGERVIQVARSDAPTPEQERREIDIHLQVWQVTHPAATVELL